MKPLANTEIIEATLAKHRIETIIVITKLEKINKDALRVHFKDIRANKDYVTFVTYNPKKFTQKQLNKPYYCSFETGIRNITTRVFFFTEKSTKYFIGEELTKWTDTHQPKNPVENRKVNVSWHKD